MSQSFSFDPLSREFAANPYEIYRELRAMDKPFFFEEQNMWLLSRYEDVDAVTTDPTMVRSLAGLAPQSEIDQWQRDANWHDMPFHEKVVQFSLLDSDGDIHRRLRKQVFGHFTGNAVRGLENMVQDYVDRLLDGLKQRGEVEFISDFACHIPGHVIGKVLGAAEEDCPQLRLWSEQVVQFFDVDRSDARKEIAETATREFYHYLKDLMAERRSAPQDDLISKMVAAEPGAFASDDEIISTAMLILMAGHGSTIDVLGSGMHLLIKHPQVADQLREAPEKLPDAIQEMFRCEPPLPFFHRHSTKDTIINGHHYKAGTTFGLLYGSANRDPNAFDNADQFDISRNPNRHLAFGRGAHLCLGNHLARLNMKVVFSTLLKRFSNFELLEPNVEYKRGLSVRGPIALKMAWHRA